MSIEETIKKETVGFVWTLHEETDGKKQSFLCDFVILEPKRRQGYATAALSFVEQLAADAGCQESVLFVADKNYPAKALYQKCGYQFLRKFEHGIYMVKVLTK
jgi:ribosomal protein S18 acetylase RimI-like enzyme